MLILIVGNSGSGKTTQKKILTSEYGFKKITTYTTREKRVGELEGVDYYFLSREEFEKKIEDNFFFEHTEYCGNLYGTSLKSIEDAASSKDKYVLIVESNGALAIKEKIEAKAIYLKIPREEIENRLKERNDDEISIKTRLEEVENSEKICDYVIDGTLPIEEVTKKILEITGE